MKIVAGDIGGTHARFAIAELAEGTAPTLGPVHTYRTLDHDGLVSAWTAFARDSGGVLPPAASVGVAAPIEGDVLRFVNSAWTIDRRTIAATLGLERLVLLNDFGAVAHAASAVHREHFERLAGPVTDLAEHEVVTVLGPGTGLGVAILIRRGEHVDVVETEAAHIAFAPQTDAERRVELALRERHGRCSVERVVSGPGLLDIHAALGGDWDPRDPGGLWKRALDGGDPRAVKALDLLTGALGAAAGDFSLAHGSTAVVIAGGLANRMRARLGRPDFHARFTDKGRYRQRMERVSVMLLTVPEPGLLGAAVAFQRLER